MNYSELKTIIDAYVNRNGVQAITGSILNGVLNEMVDQLGRGYQIMGVAEPTDDPGLPDGPECWFAGNPGTYTNFGGITVIDGEIALLCYDTGWTKRVFFDGFANVEATVDSSVGTPTASVSYADGTLTFTFSNLKGDQGNPAEVGAVTASVDDTTGTPEVTVTTSGPDTAKNIDFDFKHLKGETGDAAGFGTVVATVDNNEGIPSVSVVTSGPDTAKDINFAFRNLKGPRGSAGVAAGFGTVLATVDGNVGTPAVDILSSGPDSYKNFTFRFTNLKGEQGEQGPRGIQGVQGVQGPQGPAGVQSAVVSVDNHTGVPYATASVEDGVLSISFYNLKGDQGNTGASVDYPYELVNNLTTDDATKGLSAAMGVALDEEIGQVDQKVEGVGQNYIPRCSIGADGDVNGNAGWFITKDYIPVSNGDTIVWNPGVANWGGYLCLYDNQENYLADYSASAVERTITLNDADVAYIRVPFDMSNLADAKIIRNGDVVWTPSSAPTGVSQRVDELSNEVDTLVPERDLQFVIQDGTAGNYLDANRVLVRGDNTAAIPVIPGRKYRITITKQPHEGYTYYLRLNTYTSDSPSTFIANRVRAGSDNWNKYYVSGDVFSINNGELGMTVMIDERTAPAEDSAVLPLRETDFDPGEISIVEINPDSVVEKLKYEMETRLSNRVKYSAFDPVIGKYITYSNNQKVEYSSSGLSHISIPVDNIDGRLVLTGFEYTPSTGDASTYTTIIFFDENDNFLSNVSVANEGIMALDKPANAASCYVNVPVSHIGEISIYTDNVTEEEAETLNTIQDLLVGVSFIGEGTTFVSPSVEGAIVYKKPLNGRRYRISRIRHDVDNTLIPPQQGWNILVISCYKNNVETRLYTYGITYTTQEIALADYYDVEIPENMDADYLAVGGRALAGTPVEYRVELASESAVGVDLFNPYNEFLPKFMSAKKKAYVNGVLQTEPLVFAQISDCHADATNVGRAIAYLSKFSSYIDFYVNTGDNVLDSYENGNSWYSNISGTESFLYTIGNHDTAKREGGVYEWDAHVGIDAYNTFIGPYVSGWGVTQPAGASENGYCYYYRDFAVQNIRAIFLDMMNYDTSQDGWFASILESARTAGMEVLVFAHFPGREYVHLDCNYTSLAPNHSEDDAINYASQTSVMQNATMRVHEFITGGGSFISWIVGHTHFDVIGKVNDYQEQLVFCCDTAKHYGVNAPNPDTDSVADTKTQDGFCVVGIDVYSKVIKVFKIGRNRDLYDRVKHAFCINYQTQEILADN